MSEALSSLLGRPGFQCPLCALREGCAAKHAARCRQRIKDVTCSAFNLHPRTVNVRFRLYFLQELDITVGTAAVRDEMLGIDPFQIVFITGDNGSDDGSPAVHSTSSALIENASLNIRRCRASKRKQRFRHRNRNGSATGARRSRIRDCARLERSTLHAENRPSASRALHRSRYPDHDAEPGSRTAISYEPRTQTRLSPLPGT